MAITKCDCIEQNWILDLLCENDHQSKLEKESCSVYNLWVISEKCERTECDSINIGDHILYFSVSLL